MKKNYEFDEKRLDELKQHFHNHREVWQTIRSVNRKSLIYNHISRDQWYQHLSEEFQTVGNVAEEEHDAECANDEIEDVLFDAAISKEEV